MENILVIYYSNKGSNKYLAGKISKSLSCEIEEIKPRLNIFLLFLMNIHLGIKPLKHRIEDFNMVILCGPIWMGKLIPPLRSFIKNYFNKINKSAHLENNELLKNRLGDIEKIIYSKDSNAMIVSHMTKDLNLIIENMKIL